MRNRVIEAGALRALEAGVVSGDDSASLHCLKALFSASTDISFLTVIARYVLVNFDNQLQNIFCLICLLPFFYYVYLNLFFLFSLFDFSTFLSFLDVHFVFRSSVPMALSIFASSCNDEKHDLAVKILSLLAWNIDSRVYLQTAEFAEVFIALITTNLIKASSRWVSLTLRYLCLGYKHPRELLDAHIIAALQGLYNIDGRQSPNISQDIVEVIRAISSTPGCETALATTQTITMLRRAAEICRTDRKAMYSITVILYK